MTSAGKVSTEKEWYITQEGVQKPVYIRASLNRNQLFGIYTEIYNIYSSRQYNFSTA